MKHRHLKVVDPVRFFIAILIGIMIIVFTGYTLIGAGEAEAAMSTSCEQVVVHDGDSVWGIAERCNPDVNISTRDIVYEIYEINGIDADDIQPGDMIYVPVY